MASASGTVVGRIPRHSQLRTHQRRLRHVLRLLVRNVCTTAAEYDVSQISFYYTICLPGQQECIYTSEVIEGSRNPQWSAIHFSSECESLKLAVSSFDVCFWYSLGSPQGNFTVAWSQTLSIPSMYYTGYVSSNDGKSYPPNTIFIETVDGFYCQLQDNTMLLTDDQGFKLLKCMDSSVVFEAAHVKHSCDKEGFKRLSDCTNKLLESHTVSLSTRKRLKEYSERKSHIQELKHRRQQHLIKIRQLKERLVVEKDALENDTVKLSEAKTSLSSTELSFECALKKLQQDLKRLTSYQSFTAGHYCEIKRSSSNRKRIMIHELSLIFPIHLDITTKAGLKGNVICKVLLPGDFEEICKTKHSHIALGFVAHSITLMARILGKQLRFPLQLFGSNSTIQDDCSPEISLETRDQGYPLFYRKDHKQNFLHALAMLSNDIAQLRQYCTLPSSKQKNLLVNLKSLFDRVGAIPGSDKLSVPKTRNRLATFDADMSDMSTTDHSAPSQNTIALMQPHKGENGRVSESEYNSPGQATGLETHIPVYSSSEESGSVSCFIEEH